MMRRTIRFLVTLALSLLVAPFAAEAQPAEKLREQVIGTWKLVSNSYWPDAVGRLMYGSDGQMCVTIMRPDRLKFSTPTPFGGSTAEERAAAAAGYVNYCGSYHVNDEKGIVTDRIELSLFPNWVGVAACEQDASGLPTRACVGQRFMRIDALVGRRSVRTSQHSCAKGLPTRPWANTLCKRGQG